MRRSSSRPGGGDQRQQLVIEELAFSFAVDDNQRALVTVALVPASRTSSVLDDVEQQGGFAGSGHTEAVGLHDPNFVVGNEGFTPTALAAGIRRSPHRAQVQIAGDAFKVSASALETLLPSSPQFQKLLNRYAAVHQMQVAQTAGCNRLHNLEQRLARWLLLTQDRVESGLLWITHDFLATMLGTDRPSVSLAASALQKKRIIQYSHGTVRILII